MEYHEMEFPTPPTHDGGACSVPAAKSATTALGASSSNILVINSEPGYPNRIAIPRYFHDLSDAANVSQLASAVLDCYTDGLLHYSRQGTFIVLKLMTQTKLWGPKECVTSPLTGLIPVLNHWMHERTEILKGTRAVGKRVAKSDEALDEFGYPDLRRTLLGLAGRKPKRLQILDIAGDGGILIIPPRAHLIPAKEIDEPATPNGVIEVVGMASITQVLSYIGAQFEAATKHVSSNITEGGFAYVRRPRKTTARTPHVHHIKVVHDTQERDDEIE